MAEAIENTDVHEIVHQEELNEAKLAAVYGMGHKILRMNGRNNLAYKTRCDSTVADAALRVGVESRRSFARWMVFFMLLLFFNASSFFS